MSNWCGVTVELVTLWWECEKEEGGPYRKWRKRSIMDWVRRGEKRARTAGPKGTVAPVLGGRKVVVKQA